MANARFIAVVYDDDEFEFEGDINHGEELEDSFEDGVSFFIPFIYFIGIFSILFDRLLFL